RQAGSLQRNGAEQHETADLLGESAGHQFRDLRAHAMAHEHDGATQPTGACHDVFGQLVQVVGAGFPGALAHSLQIDAQGIACTAAVSMRPPSRYTSSRTWKRTTSPNTTWSPRSPMGMMRSSLHSSAMGAPFTRGGRTAVDASLSRPTAVNSSTSDANSKADR